MAESTIAAFIATIALKIFEKCAPESGLSLPKLLKRLSEGTITAKGRERLATEAEKALREWRQLQIPPMEGEKARLDDEDWDVCICPAQTASDVRSTACPVGRSTDIYTPLYLEVHSNSVEDVRDDLLGLISNLSKTSPLSDKLLCQVDLGIKPGPIVWVSLPNTIIRSADDAFRLINDLNENIRLKIKRCRRVYEIPIPLYILSQVAASGFNILPIKSATRQDSSGAYSTPACEYVSFADKAMASFKSGMILTHLRHTEKMEFPLKFLTDKHKEKFQEVYGEINLWTTVGFWGPPGTCKSLMVSALTQNLAESEKRLVLDCSAPGLHDTISECVDNMGVGFEKLAKLFADAINVPGEFKSSPLARKAFADALEFYLINHFPTVFVFDDLDRGTPLEEKVQELRRQAHSLNVLVILSGRTEFSKAFEREKLRHFEMEFLNKTEALNLISSWKIDPDRCKMIRDALETGTFSSYKFYSTHMIELMAEFMSHFSESLNTMLDRKLNKYLTPLIRSLPRLGDRRRAEVVLNDLQNMLEAGETHENMLALMERDAPLDIREILGLWAWTSRYDKGRRESHDVHSGAVGFRYWLGQYLRSDDEAQNLIRLAIDAGIFKMVLGVATFHDDIARDGLAVLHLARKVMKGGDPVEIISMISDLYDQNSIQILILTLDVDLLALILSMIKDRPELVACVDQFLIPDYLAILKSNPESADQLASSLISCSNQLSQDSLIPVFSALSKLLDISESTNVWCEEKMGAHDKEGLIALGARSVKLKDNPSYFGLANDRNAPVSDTMKIVSQTWTAHGAPYIIDFLTNNYQTSDTAILQTCWRDYCSKRTTREIFKIIGSLSHMLNDPAHKKHNEFYTELCEIALELAVTTRFPGARQAAQNMRSQIGSLYRNGFQSLAKRLVKWVAYSFEPDLVDPSVEWVISHDGEYALPIKPNEPQKFSHIVDLLYDDNYHDYFSLPTKSELKAAGCTISEIPEIVGDGFKGRNIKGKLPTECFKIWPEGKDMDFLPSDQINTKAIHWRPRLLLSDQS